MFFNNVSNLVDKNDKKFFKEQIDVFIRMTEVCCEKYHMTNDENDNINEDDLNELIDIGVINNNSDLSNLKSLLKGKFSSFIKSVKFCKNNKDTVYDAVWKLYNSERKKLQKEHVKYEELTLADFFCGAGGLSLGFIQEGFNIKLANDIEDVCIQTYKYNHPQLNSNYVVQEDIKALIEDIDNLINCEIDVVVGGPPCQGFSQANQQRIINL